MVLVVAACEGDALRATAQVEVEPRRVDFGPVASGEVRSAALTVRNTSPTGTLEFDRIELAAASDPSFQLQASARPLGPGESLTVDLRYTADSDPDADGAEVVVVSSSTNEPRVVVPLQADATAARLAVTPERVDFGPLADGDGRTSNLTVENLGLAPLELSRVSLRVGGFDAEACVEDGDCRAGRCVGPEGLRGCAPTCGGGQACPTASTCANDERAGPVCVGLVPPRMLRGFALDAASPRRLAPRERLELPVRYQPGPGDRGGAEWILESTDPLRPFWVVPLSGRPDDRPPVAVATRVGADTLEPGSTVELDGAQSTDPEGGALSYRWSFRVRPDGSQARPEDVGSARTRARLDLPGRYVVALEVRDPGGQRSQNLAEVTADVDAGGRVEIVLGWDRSDALLGLHVVAPGAALDTFGDCTRDNPTPDWAPAGPSGDPTWSGAGTTESVAVTGPADGVYAVAVRVDGASPAGATQATVLIRYVGFEVARFSVVLDPGTQQWDVATISRPSGRIITLGTLR